MQEDPDASISSLPFSPLPISTPDPPSSASRGLWKKNKLPQMVTAKSGR